MLKTWTLERFKSVYDRSTIDLAPLTVFAGANSSGKSTLIQSILLTAQTIHSALYPRCVILNGDIARLGAFTDILSNGSDTPIISIGFTLEPDFRAQEDTDLALRDFYRIRYPREYMETLLGISCDFSFSNLGPKEQREVLQLQPVLERSTVKVSVKETTNSEENEIIIQRRRESMAEIFSRFRLSDKSVPRQELPAFEYEVLKPTRLRQSPSSRYYRGLVTQGQLAGMYVRHFLPDRYSVVFDATDERALRLLDLISDYPENRYFHVASELDASVWGNNELRDLLVEIFLEIISDPTGQVPYTRQRAEQTVEALSKKFDAENLTRATSSLRPEQRRTLRSRIETNRERFLNIFKGGKGPEYQVAPTPLPDFLAISVDYIQTFFSQRVRYLGPLRDEPKPVYPLAGASDPSDVGLKGEHTAAVLDVHRNTQIRYMPSMAVDSHFKSYSPIPTSLQQAVRDWLQYMGIAENVRTEDKGKLGHELTITTQGDTALHDLTHVGVGVSQVLPILVLSLLADRGSTLIFEQPELHLHPRVQTRLADFFVSLTLSGKQCIVETHSEYLINRMRFLAASSEGSQLADSVRIYFVEKIKGHSSYRSVRINRFGVITDWPEGFFDENEKLSAAVIRASARKRAQESNKNDISND